MHKFKVKRNCWPKTRGVAMNPVDHVRTPPVFALSLSVCVVKGADDLAFSLTAVATINISARHRPSLDTRHRVKRLVSLRRGERVCYVVPRRPRTRRIQGSIRGRCRRRRASF